jgi:hypothetical protein
MIMTSTGSTIRGGIHYGKSYTDSINATWPFAVLGIDKEALTLETFWRKFIFEKERIAGISVYKGFLSKGIKIEHMIEKYPIFIVFWTFDLRSLRHVLVENGYSLKAYETTEC